MLKEFSLPQEQPGLGRRAEQRDPGILHATSQWQKRLKPCMLLRLGLKTVCYNSQVFYKDKKKISFPPNSVKVQKLQQNQQ